MAHRFARNVVLFYLLLTLFTLGGYYSSYILWQSWILALFTAALVNWLVAALLARTVFAGVPVQGRRPWQRPEEWGEPGPHDYVPGWWSRKQRMSSQDKTAGLWSLKGVAAR